MKEEKYIYPQKQWENQMTSDFCAEGDVPSSYERKLFSIQVILMNCEGKIKSFSDLQGSNCCLSHILS